MPLPSICILAGGRGTRLGELTEDTPKPLILVGGKPFLEHILLSLAELGAKHIVLSVGYLSEQFREVLGNGERFGLQLEYVEDGETPAGTAGGVRNCLALLDDPFIVMYGDSLLRVNPSDLVAAHSNGGRLATMVVMRSSLGHEAPNCSVHHGIVTAYAKAPTPANAQFIDYGMLMFSKKAFSGFEGANLSDLQTALAASGDLAAFEATVPYTEIGTPDALAAARNDLHAGS